MNTNLEETYGNAKSALRKSDYKIIKCIEAFLCGEELPYDIKEIHNSREQYRNTINNIENLWRQ